MCPDPTRLPSLIGSRICHDLVSPLGAIGNGVELLMMSAAGAGPELALISESVTSAMARIRFFRIAYGAIGADAEVPRAEILSILADMTTGSRLDLRWAAAGNPPRSQVKLAFLALQCFESAMPHGGQVRVQEEAGRWRIETRDSQIRYDPALWAALEGGAAPEISPAQVQFALLPAELAARGRRAALAATERSITLSY